MAFDGKRRHRSLLIRLKMRSSTFFLSDVKRFSLRLTGLPRTYRRHVHSDISVLGEDRTSSYLYHKRTIDDHLSVFGIEEHWVFSS